MRFLVTQFAQSNSIRSPLYMWCFPLPRPIWDIFDWLWDYSYLWLRNPLQREVGTAERFPRSDLGGLWYEPFISLPYFAPRSIKAPPRPAPTPQSFTAIALKIKNSKMQEQSGNRVFSSPSLLPLFSSRLPLQRLRLFLRPVCRLLWNPIIQTNCARAIEWIWRLILPFTQSGNRWKRTDGLKRQAFCMHVHQNET